MLWAPFWGEVMKAGPGSSKRPDLKPGRVLGLTAPPMPGSEWGPRDLGPQPGGVQQLWAPMGVAHLPRHSPLPSSGGRLPCIQHSPAGGG